ncbi:hypothetical protein DFJ73DRAFT_302152 [Zopfochytrium polystomum]|nr:hypothetical protein DFJ73DRAFT_302152 [Zopfochytrium polystomum]
MSTGAPISATPTQITFPTRPFPTRYPCGLGRSCDSIACTLSKVFRISEKDLADWTRLSCVSFYPDINPSDGLKCNLIQNTCAVGQIVSTLDSDYMEHSGWFCFFGYRLGGRTEVKEATRIAKMAVKQAAIAQEGLVRTLQAATGAEAAAAALVGEEAASKAAWAAKVVERAKNSLLLDVKEELALQWMADSATVSAARARNSAFKAKLAADWAAGVAAARQGHPE